MQLRKKAGKIQAHLALPRAHCCCPLRARAAQISVPPTLRMASAFGGRAHAGAPVMTLARTSLPATGAPSTSSTAGLVFSCSMACLARPRALAAHPRAPPAKRLPGRPWLTLACKQAVLTGLLISTVTRAGTRTGHRPAARGSLAERLQPRGRAPIRLGARRPQARAGSGRAPTCTRTPGGWCSAGARTARTGW